MQKTYLVLSDKLKELLQKKKLKSEVSQHLLDPRPFRTDVNYIDYVIDGDKIMFSYLPNSKAVDPASPDFWEAKQRVKIKPGSLLTKLLKDNLSESHFEHFISLLKLALSESPQHTVKIASGEDIKGIYFWENYYQGGGNSILGKSCMRYDYTLPFLELYYKNPNVVSCVYVEQDGLVAARALLWKAKLGRSNVTVLDRIYYYQMEHQEALHAWGEENATYIKNHSHGSFIESASGKMRWLDLRVPLEEADYTYYPYVDTFYFKNGKSLYNVRPARNSVQILTGTGGRAGLETQTLPPRPTGYTQSNSVYIGGVWYKKSDVILYQNRYLDNRSKTFQECKECGIVTRTTELITTPDGAKICTAHTHYKNKPICPIHHVVYETTGCSACSIYPKCTICDIRSNSTVSLSAETRVCHVCLPRFYDTCSICYQYMSKEETTVLVSKRLCCASCVQTQTQKCIQCDGRDWTQHLIKNSKEDCMCNKCYDKQPRCRRCNRNAFLAPLTGGLCTFCNNAEPGTVACSCPCGCYNTATHEDLCATCSGVE